MITSKEFFSPCPHMAEEGRELSGAQSALRVWAWALPGARRPGTRWARGLATAGRRGPGRSPCARERRSWHY